MSEWMREVLVFAAGFATGLLWARWMIRLGRNFRSKMAREVDEIVKRLDGVGR
jgi:hypothetical protein